MGGSSCVPSNRHRLRWHTPQRREFNPAVTNPVIARLGSITFRVPYDLTFSRSVSSRSHSTLSSGPTQRTRLCTKDLNSCTRLRIVWISILVPFICAIVALYLHLLRRRRPNFDGPPVKGLCVKRRKDISTRSRFTRELLHGYKQTEAARNLGIDRGGRGRRFEGFHGDEVDAFRSKGEADDGPRRLRSECKQLKLD